MLKFIKHHMETIAGIEIYPIISFVIFFTFFIGLFAYVLIMRKGYIEELENLPLNEND
ncbi:MAG: CcoQ/FixQ family Cbb3-type cytochrome c oxidase assembly chaperone [Cryomorphaceae bacterium]